MDTEVIILAQGAHRRLGNHCGFRQLLPLPACGHAPILSRTLRQLSESENGALSTVTIVAQSSLTQALFQIARWPLYTVCVELPEPGNSALKGIARYLELREAQGRRYPRTVVLLGDVVYSWACLEAIWKMAQTCGFVGTRDLSLDRGQLWGVSWARSYDGWMLPNLADALLRHPPVDDEHVPGQLRRWVSGMKRGDLGNHVTHLRHRVPCGYIDIDDYTHDIDSPSDLVLLPELSALAAADDAKRGSVWNQEANMKGA